MLPIDGRLVEIVERLRLHRRFHVAPCMVEPVQLGSQRLRFARVVGQQAPDADRHVREPARGIEARAGDEAQVEGRGLSGVAARHFEEGAHAGLGAAGAQARQALVDKNAVRLIETHDVGHRAKRHQVEKLREIGLVARGESPRFAQMCAQRDQHIEHHAHAGDVLARECTVGLVRVDDDCR